jgi:hypothetical protein
VLSDNGNRLLLLGLVLLILADVVLAFATSPLIVFAGAALWGLHMAFTQGLLSTWLPFAPAELRGTAFGMFNLSRARAARGKHRCRCAVGRGWSKGTFLAGAAITLVALLGLVAIRTRMAPARRRQALAVKFKKPSALRAPDGALSAHQFAAKQYSSQRREIFRAAALQPREDAMRPRF